MDNKISINKIIADIKATKGNRSGCQGLSSSLESDGYITSICKWVRATSPDRINALVEHVEKQDAALIAWEKTMMEVCGEDGPASVANEIRSLRALRDTAIQALKSQVEQLAAENVALKRVPETNSVAMLLALDSFRSESLPDVGLQKAFESLMYHRKTPATDRIVEGVKASAIPEGFKLVPEQMYLSDEDIQAICMQCGNGDKKGYGDYEDGILWVGELSNDGEMKYGLNIANANYPEEGSITVFEFDEPLREGVDK